MSRIASRIMPRLYLGNAAAAMGAPENGFTAIVNCSPTGRPAKYGICVHYIEHDINVDGALPEKVEKFINRWRSFGIGNVLIHCETGTNLSAVVAIAYYMVTENVSLAAAVQHCASCWPNILTSDYFVRILNDFEQQRRVCALWLQAAELEEKLIAIKREIAVITLDCDYKELTIDDYKAMMDKMSSDTLATGLTSDEKAKKYLKICAKYDDKRKENNL